MALGEASGQNCSSTVDKVSSWGIYTSSSFLACNSRLRSAIRRHHPPQRAVLSQICCFGEHKMVMFQILLDGAEPCDAVELIKIHYSGLFKRRKTHPVSVLSWPWDLPVLTSSCWAPSSRRSCAGPSYVHWHSAHAATISASLAARGVLHHVVSSQSQI